PHGARRESEARRCVRRRKQPGGRGAWRRSGTRRCGRACQARGVDALRDRASRSADVLRRRIAAARHRGRRQLRARAPGGSHRPGGHAAGRVAAAPGPSVFEHLTTISIADTVPSVMRTSVLVLGLLALTTSASAQTFTVPVVYNKLPNGLRVVVSENDAARVVMVEEMYHMRCVIQPPDRTAVPQL